MPRTSQLCSNGSFSGHLDHDSVECEVGGDLRSPVPARRRTPHLRDLPLERANVSLDLHRSLAGSKLLEHCPHREHRQQLRVVDGAHPGASKRLRLDEAKELEIAEGLAYRRLARAELPREPCLDEPLAGLELAAQDALEQDLLHLLPEDGALDRQRVTRRRPGS